MCNPFARTKECRNVNLSANWPLIFTRTPIKQSLTKPSVQKRPRNTLWVQLGFYYVHGTNLSTR